MVKEFSTIQVYKTVKLPILGVATGIDAVYKNNTGEFRSEIYVMFSSVAECFRGSRKVNGWPDASILGCTEEEFLRSDAKREISDYIFKHIDERLSDVQKTRVPNYDELLKIADPKDVVILWLKGELSVPQLQLLKQSHCPELVEIIDSFARNERPRISNFEIW